MFQPSVMIMTQLLNQKQVAFHRQENYLCLCSICLLFQRKFLSQHQHQIVPSFDPPIEYLGVFRHIASSLLLEYDSNICGMSPWFYRYFSYNWSLILIMFLVSILVWWWLWMVLGLPLCNELWKLFDSVVCGAAISTLRMQIHTVSLVISQNSTIITCYWSTTKSSIVTSVELSSKSSLCMIEWLVELMMLVQLLLSVQQLSVVWFLLIILHLGLLR